MSFLNIQKRMIMSNKRNKTKKENSQKKEKNKGTLIGQISVALSNHYIRGILANYTEN